MTVEDRFKERYKAGDTPWDIGRPDDNLVRVVSSTPIPPCAALDIGCGTGDNAVWLAGRKFQVTAIDASEVAVEKAGEKARRAGVACVFAVTDIRNARVDGAPFGFAFDRGFFHLLGADDERRAFAENVARNLGAGGLWLSLLGNADDPRKTPGPPQRTALQIVGAVEPFFEILSLASGHFGSNRATPPRAWICLMRKRP